MRLWSLHPSSLDARGLVALWREGLLARKVLQGRTRGYRHHPQLIRFRAHRDPVAAINTYLSQVHVEATRRGYHFDGSKIRGARTRIRLRVTHGQLRYEWTHLLKKLKRRAPADYRSRRLAKPAAHPMFLVAPGSVESWERGWKAG